MTSGWLIVGLAGLVAAAGAAPVPKRLSLWMTAAASAVLAAGTVLLVTEGTTVQIALWSPAPYMHLALRFDALSAVFALGIGVVSAAACVFAVGYSRPRAADDFALPIFVLAMVCVVAAANVVTFLFAWEAMALSSFVLVMGDGLARPRRMAAVLYGGMTHVATVAVTGAFFIVAHAAGSQDFARMSAVGGRLSPALASVAFLLAVAGFGTKAGLVPFHVWLPRAHPVAPSHVSALMSGAMVNTGLYGIIRVGAGFLGPGEAWWGVGLMAAGCLSAVLGILYALFEQDMKRVLAFSTIENVGIMTVAIGAALTFQAHGLDALAAAAMVAALLHSLSHGVLKAALFLGAGAVQRTTHTLSLDRLGGLARTMPVTGAVALLASLAISGLPPLSGFPGEWLLFRSLFVLGGEPVGALTRMAALGALGAMALTGGLALACFVRLSGISFLGLPRSQEAAQAHDGPWTMRLPLLGLGAIALAGGVAASVVIRAVTPAGEVLFGQRGVATSGASQRIVDAGGGALSLLVVAAALALTAGLAWLGLRLYFGATRVERGPIWSTGVVFRPSMQYTATSLSKPLRSFFSRVLLPERRVVTEFHAGSPLPKVVHYSGRVPPIIEERLYHPARSLAIWSARRVRGLQNGSVQLYLLYIVGTLVVLLVVTQ